MEQQNQNQSLTKELVRSQETAVKVNRIENPHPRTLYTLFTGETMSTGTETIDIGSEVPEHKHENSEEILFCTGGKGEIYVSGVAKSFIPGVMAFVPKNTLHRIVNLSENEDLCLTWTLSPPLQVEQFKAQD